MNKEKPKNERRDDEYNLVWQLPEVAIIRFFFRIAIAGASGIVALLTRRHSGK